VTGGKTISVGGSVGGRVAGTGWSVNRAGAAVVGGTGAIMGAEVAANADDGATVGPIGLTVRFDDESGNAESCDVEEEEGRLE
jgi:hypothetical protein